MPQANKLVDVRLKLVSSSDDTFTRSGLQLTSCQTESFDVLGPNGKLLVRINLAPVLNGGVIIDVIPKQEELITKILNFQSGETLLAARVPPDTLVSIDVRRIR